MKKSYRHIQFDNYTNYMVRIYHLIRDKTELSDKICEIYNYKRY